MIKTVCFVVCIFGMATCDKVAESGQEARKAKFLSFNSVDDEFKIDLEFSIPFLSIPVKKFMNSLHPGYGNSPSINVNSGALVLGGIFILTTTFILPLLLKHHASHYKDERMSRALETTEFGIDSILDLANQILIDGGKLSGCPQRVACWMGKETSKESPLWFWNQISSDPFVTLLLNPSSIEEAVSTGRKGSECTKYAPCPLNEENSAIFMKNLAVLTSPYKQP